MMSNTDILDAKLKQATQTALQANAQLLCASSSLAKLQSDFNKVVNTAATATPMGKAECIECVDALAPVTKIRDCLAGGGFVMALWGTKKAIASAVLYRIIEINGDCSEITAKKLSVGNTSSWTESNAVVLMNPAKFILKLVLIPRLGA